MGFFSRVRASFSRSNRRMPPPSDAEREVVVGALNGDAPEGEVIQTFTNKNITFSGDIRGYDYKSIQRDKQKNIYRLYELSDYFVDADPIFRGIITHVYTPYATISPFKLVGGTKATRQKYYDYYKKIRLSEKWKSIAYQYFKYANVFIYFFEGNIITLPPHLCRIGGISLNGDAIAEFNARSVVDSLSGASGSVKKDFMKDERLETLLKGYPPEIVKAVKEGKEWVQMNPENTFVMQGFKEDWQRYSIPMIASCLPPLAKKALIEFYEDSLLNLGARGILHVRYGVSRNEDYLPSRPEIAQTQQIFRKAMSGFPLAVTNQLVEAKHVQSDMQDLFQFDKYKDVNNGILSAGGVSGLIVTGLSEDGSTFANAQVSMKTASTRIQLAMDTFAEIMCKINMRINGDEKGVSRSKASSVPEFIFMPFDIDGKKGLQKAGIELWKQGVVSTETMLLTQGYDINEEADLRRSEKSKGLDETLAVRGAYGSTPTAKDGDAAGKPGRPRMDESERTSDPERSESGKAPKPSSPEGSMGDD